MYINREFSLVVFDRVYICETGTKFDAVKLWEKLEYRRSDIMAEGEGINNVFVRTKLS